MEPGVNPDNVLDKIMVLSCLFGGEVQRDNNDDYALQSKSYYVL